MFANFSASSGSAAVPRPDSGSDAGAADRNKSPAALLNADAVKPLWRNDSAHTSSMQQPIYNFLSPNALVFCIYVEISKGYETQLQPEAVDSGFHKYTIFV